MNKLVIILMITFSLEGIYRPFCNKILAETIMGEEKLHNIILDEKLDEKAALEKIIKIKETFNKEDFNKFLHDIEYQDGVFPIHVAAKRGYLNIVKFFIENNPALLNSLSTGNKYSLIHMASMSNDERVLNLLIGKGLKDVNCKSVNGLTPLHFAVANNFENITKILIKHKADPTIKSKVTGISPLSIAKNKGNEKMINLLRESH